MTFQQWIDRIGFARATELTGHPISTLRMWYSMTRFPRPQQMVTLLDTSGGLLNIEQWTRDFTSKKAA
ncbi:hypothetical protein [Photobacterium leiognathi]|uniref:hypothetical protein n=1 Tax=Photobacterium leiognathi TaxID=553611 RepID=UPI00273A0645|nr:hypothetical protein [Photobacterium leiognathi]